jgi:hypothetical protein
MIVVPHLSPAVLFLMVTTGFGACVGAVVAARAKNKRRRSRRVLAIHVRLETEWQNARMRMYLSGPIGSSLFLFPGVHRSGNVETPGRLRLHGSRSCTPEPGPSSGTLDTAGAARATHRADLN